MYCGEQIPWGSPPRMRGKGRKGHGSRHQTRITPAYAGKALLRSRELQALGITPAYAGKRMTCLLSMTAAWDHPRVCGEKHEPAQLAVVVLGITPAYAGKSCGTSQQSRWSGDHPRVCGEKLRYISAVKVVWGSPPRMRGKALVHSFGSLDVRITPAYAGKS